MVPFALIPVRRRRQRRRAGKSVRPLLVTYANFNDDGLFLIFSRAIDITNLDGTKFVITTPELRFEADAGELETADRVRLHMVEAGTNVGTATLLNVSAGNGIAAVDDGTAWAGVANWKLV